MLVSRKRRVSLIGAQAFDPARSQRPDFLKKEAEKFNRENTAFGLVTLMRLARVVDD